MKKAIIDLGTNTFNLLIAEVNGKDLKVIHSEKEGVAIGMGGINSNTITEESMQRGKTTIGHFLSVCTDFQVDNINAFGTSALRDANNTGEFLERLKTTFDLSVSVISGFKEAELIYSGVSQLYDFRSKGVIIDIGGGSTEVIFADKNGVNDVASLNIGVSRLYQHFDWTDPISETDIKKIKAHLDQHSEGFLENRNEPLMIGSSGSYETFWELIHLEKFPDDAKVYPMDVSIFREVLEQTIQSTRADRDANRFIIPIRKLMAPITAVKTQWLMEKLNTKKILISPYSLKEGALFSEKI